MVLPMVEMAFFQCICVLWSVSKKRVLDVHSFVFGMKADDVWTMCLLLYVELEDVTFS